MSKSKLLISAEVLAQLGLSVKESIELIESQKAVDMTPAKVRRLMKYKEYCRKCKMKESCMPQQIDELNCLVHA